ncbi:MAG: GNAT family N-acetyltransferase [Hyphomicrobiales bacterium]|jgi:CelD/BcsL family acetyltransferase involved in cellulose biosynthesis
MRHDVDPLCDRSNDVALSQNVDGGEMARTSSLSVPKAAGGLRVDCLSKRDEILDLQDAWHRLEAISQTNTVFQAFDLCMPWLDAYVFGKDPTHEAQVIALYQGGELVGLLPLAVPLGSPVVLAEWIGEPLVQYGDMLLDPSCDHVALGKALKDAISNLGVDGLLLRAVRADAAIHDVLPLNAATQAGVARQAATADLTDFETADDYFATFSPKSRKRLRRRRKELAKAGDLGFKVMPAGPDVLGIYDLALSWKKAWLADNGLTSRTFMDERALATLRDAIGRAGKHNPFTAFVQTLNEKPVAIAIGLVGPQGKAVFLTAYSPEHGALSPGMVQIESTIRFGFESGWPTYDLMAPLDQYKTSWTNTICDVADHVVAFTPKARLYRGIYLSTLRPAMKAVWKAIPAPLRTAALRLSGGPTEH